MLFLYYAHKIYALEPLDVCYVLCLFHLIFICWNKYDALHHERNNERRRDEALTDTIQYVMNRSTQWHFNACTYICVFSMLLYQRPMLLLMKRDRDRERRKNKIHTLDWSVVLMRTASPTTLDFPSTLTPKHWVHLHKTESITNRNTI